MADHVAIFQLFSDYGWPMDSREFSVLEGVFTDDAEFTVSIAGGDTYGPYVGRKTILDFVSATVGAQNDQRRHVITNIRIGPESESDAKATATLTLIVVADGVLTVKASGLYETQVVHDRNAWRFSKMNLTLDVPF